MKLVISAHGTNIANYSFVTTRCNRAVAGGYKMFVGISAAYEVDFIAEKDGKKLYVQCAYLMNSEQTRQREFRTLLTIRDNFPKLVVTMDEPSGGNIEGVEHWHLRDFLSRDW